MASSVPLDNDAIARAFAEVSDLLELTGDNPHRVRSYAAIGRTIESLPRPASDMLADGTLLVGALTFHPGRGEAPVPGALFQLADVR